VPEITHDEFRGMLEKVRQGNHFPVFLVHGQEYLVQRCAEALVDALLCEEERPFNLSVLDGENEDSSNTMHLLSSYPMFPGLRLVWVKGSRAFLSRNTAKELFEKARKAVEEGSTAEALKHLAGMCAFADVPESDDVSWKSLHHLEAERWFRVFGFHKTSEDDSWMRNLVESAPAEVRIGSGNLQTDVLEEGLEKGFAGRNILMLTAAAVDRRKRLYKLISQAGLIIDCSMDREASRKGRERRQDLILNQMKEQLAEAGKEISPDARALFLEWAGTELRSLTLELEKLIVYAGEERTIQGRHVEAVVCRTREEAVFEIMETLAERDLVRSQDVLQKLLDQGLYPLAILKVIGEEVRRLLWAKVRLPEDALSFDRFQRDVLPKLDDADRVVCGKLAPYALYLLARYAVRFSGEELRYLLGKVLETDVRLKTGAGEPRGLLLSLLTDICLGRPEEPRLPLAV